MAEIDVLKAQIVRPSPSVPWGLMLTDGGNQPLRIYGVTPGSPAAKIGLKGSDIVTEIDDQPTEGMSCQQALELINQHGQTLVLTVERRARGQVPTNPVLNEEQNAQPKFYQTYDMTGRENPRRQRVRANPPQHHQQMNDLNLPTAVSRPFESSRPRAYQPPPPQSSVHPEQPPLKPPPRQPGYNTPPMQSPTHEEDKSDSDVTQSRTFRVLSSLMANEEPYSGIAGLPPPRSATMERMKQDFSQQNPKSRVKVFMPQQYNNPMSLYSAPNVVQTFAQQAEGLMNEMEAKAAREEEAVMSSVQEAVKAADFEPQTL